MGRRRPFRCQRRSKEDASTNATNVEIQVIPGADHVATFQGSGDVLRIVRPFLDKHRL